MKKFALAGAVALVAISAGGCSKFFEEYIKKNAPAVLCSAAEKEWAKWNDAGRPLSFGGRDEKSLIRVLSDAGYAEVRSWCASKGITIN